MPEAPLKAPFGPFGPFGPSVGMPADDKPDVDDDCSAVKSSPEADLRNNDQLISAVKSTSSEAIFFGNSFFWIFFLFLACRIFFSGVLSYCRKSKKVHAKKNPN